MIFVSKREENLIGGEESRSSPFRDKDTIFFNNNSETHLVIKLTTYFFIFIFH